METTAYTQPPVGSSSKYNLDWEPDSYGDTVIHGDGYDFMHGAAEHGWAALSNWGEDGWDAGDWPYVIIFIRGHKDIGYWTMVHVEGDLSVNKFDTMGEALQNLDTTVHFYWTGSPSRYGLVDVDLADPKYHGPYGRRFRDKWYQYLEDKKYNAKQKEQA